MHFLFPLLFLITTPFPNADLPGPMAPVDSELGVHTMAMPFENIGVFDKLPIYTVPMSDEAFAKWARAQNAAAYQRARDRADGWIVRNPALDVLVQTNDYTSTSDLNQSDQASSTGATIGATSETRYSGISMQRTYRTQTRWGGGPVVIINPYVRQ